MSIAKQTLPLTVCLLASICIISVTTEPANVYTAQAPATELPTNWNLLDDCIRRCETTKRRWLYECMAECRSLNPQAAILDGESRYQQQYPGSGYYSERREQLPLDYQTAGRGLGYPGQPQQQMLPGQQQQGFPMQQQGYQGEQHGFLGQHQKPFEPQQGRPGQQQGFLSQHQRPFEPQQGLAGQHQEYQGQQYPPRNPSYSRQQQQYSEYSQMKQNGNPVAPSEQQQHQQGQLVEYQS